MVELKEGSNPMSVFGKGFEAESYCWLNGKTLWLSLIMVEKKMQRKGVLNRLLEDAKKCAPTILIPTPSKIVYHAAKKRGYRFKMVDTDDGACEVMVFKSKSPTPTPKRR